MAYGRIYTATFSGANGKEYTVNVKRSGWSDNPSAIELAGDPLSTEYDSDDDLLKPIKTQTGYLHTVEYHQNKSFIFIQPTGNHSHMLELLESGNVVWRGFFKHEQYSGDYINGSNQINYPLVSPLETLKDYKMPISKGMDIISFAGLLKEALDETGVTWGKIFIPQYIDDGTTRKWLTPLFIEVSRASFFNRFVDAEGYVQYEGKSYYELLEDLISVFGWTAYEFEDDLYLVSRSTTSYVSIDYSSLATISSGSVPTSTIVTATSRQETDLTVTSASDRYDILMGAKSVKITSKTGAVDKILSCVQDGDVSMCSTFSETMQKSGNTMCVYAICYQPNRDCEVKFYGYNNSKSSYGESNSWTTYDDGKCNGETPLRYSCTISAGVAKADYYNKADVDSGNKTDYSFSKGVVISFDWQTLDDGDNNQDCNAPTRSEAMNMPLAVFKTRSSILLQDGAIYISAGGLSIDGMPSINGMLKIGGKYWNGTSWTTTKSIFQIAVTSSGIKNTKKLSMNYYGASGYVVPITSTLKGVVEFSIIPPYGSFWTPDRGILTNLSVSFAPLTTKEYDAPTDENIYYASTGATFPEDKEVELPFSSKVGNQYGYNILIYRDALLGAKFNNMTIEKKLLNMMKSLYNHSRISVNMETELQDIKPFDRILGRTINSMSIDWYNSTININMQQL